MLSTFINIGEGPLAGDLLILFMRVSKDWPPSQECGTGPSTEKNFPEIELILAIVV